MSCFTVCRTASSSKGRAAVPRARRIFFDQVGDDLGIGLSGKFVAFLGQLLLEREIVFDDAVVHHHNLSRAIAVRMGIFFGGTSVRGPAGVADAIGSLERPLPDDLFQVAQFPLGAP